MFEVELCSFCGGGGGLARVLPSVCLVAAVLPRQVADQDRLCQGRPLTGGDGPAIFPLSDQALGGKGGVGGVLPFISVVCIVGLSEEDDGRDGDEAASLPAALHLLQQPGDGGNRDVAHSRVRAGRPTVLPES